jgi:diguanylate cyclase (GGDEF)-like protein
MSLSTLRLFFAPKEDPYAGADMGNAQRLGSVLWGLVVGLIVVLWIPSPPTEAIGGAGWVVAVVLALTGAWLVVAMRRGRMLTNWGTMLALAYGAVIAIALLEWLSGGVDSPYDRLMLLPILYVSMLHPPRRIAVFLGFCAVLLALPYVYDGWNADAAGATFAGFVIWSAIAILGAVMMQGVRAQRLALAAEEAEAREEARVDTLTGLRNRRAFDEALELEVERARRQSEPLTVAMIDIHSFKSINDGWGHAEGDRCLREVAEALGAAARKPELCFRWGGDEFALILADTTAADAAPLGSRLRGAVYINCRRPDQEPMEITFAVAELGDGMPAAELNDMAGLALTAAKSEAKLHEHEHDPDR